MPIPAATIALLGWVGSECWDAFAASPEAADGERNPLDRWSRGRIDAIAADRGATALYPFAGPPWLPFQRWAMKAEPVTVSPLGILIHPDWGLWHSYRGALAFTERLDLPPMPTRASPCASCAEKPCLTTCPVSAFSNAGYDVTGCRSHIATPSGAECLSGGCLARAACPVGPEHRYAPTQAAFHMRAFLRSSYPPGP